MTIIYHLAGSAEWEAGAASLKNRTGEYRAGSLAEEGFIHCSEDEAQMFRVASRLFNGRNGSDVTIGRQDPDYPLR